ncbi:MAG: hypothetical protein R3E12_03880 [Candidatus Eisenbacteria bacterium]
MNASMGIVAARSRLRRFFDSEISFLWREVGFIAIGAAFWIVNVAVRRRRTEDARAKPGSASSSWWLRRGWPSLHR